MSTASVIGLEEAGAGVVRVVMQDRSHKNGFSPELTDGLMQAFASIGRDTRLRAVILTGYDHYFATGGTREGLLAMHEGRSRFTDSTLYSLALHCPIPVIAAMQGHAIGGGFVFGLFADFVILSRESVYTTNFMKYGFTPGMGATGIVPRKLGAVLGGELLTAARSYRGADLEKRGVAFPVVQRHEVHECARQLAFDLAQKPRRALIELKSHLVADIREELPRIVARELQMHEATFGDPEVGQRIQTLFDN